MKLKFLTACTVAGLLVLAACLTSCSADDNTHTDDAVIPFINASTVNHLEIAKGIEDEHIFIVTDAETGVQYIVYREKIGYAGMGGITPRLNADGSLYVVDLNKESERNEEESGE